MLCYVLFCSVPQLHVSIVLSCVDLGCVVFGCAVLCRVEFRSVVFHVCMYRLRCIVLAYAMSSCTVLTDAVLCCVPLLHVSVVLCCVDSCWDVWCCDV